ncbi:LysR family transcriptional regulator [Phreatobacter oligotrophus]|uniref:LysR family transcriptional regulator n=1 Tax=Phreatobacter oligotrophus TaxID=1122261 RepID=A0A2T4YYX4_9HYPH|nr:LysR family transcriptional regulator [Phreatobacter oligotrophus]PTM51912.1 LysR family transcriptional regulator [Phreatobacter oligotrophus]
MFDLGQLRCFVAVADELHFGRAAMRLNMTQPPLSRQIQILERILDVQLIERSSRSVKLTPAGQSFLPEARHILGLAESSALLVKRVARGRAGSLKLGFTAASAYSYLPSLIAACRSELPDVALSLKEMVSGDQLKRLLAGEIDVGLMRPPMPPVGFRSFRVIAEPMLVALPRNHPRARQASVTLEQLAADPFIMYAPYESRYFHDLVVEILARGGLSPNYVQYLAQIHSILALVHAGVGIAIVPQAADNLQFRNVVLRPIASQKPALAELYMVWREQSTNPAIPILLDVARKMAA